MVSNLDYTCAPGDTAARSRARARFLRDSVRAARQALDAVKATGLDDRLLDLFVLQSSQLTFSRHNRGWMLPDADMTEKVVGPIGRALHAFDALRQLNIDEIEKAIAQCEAKVAKALDGALV